MGSIGYIYPSIEYWKIEDEGLSLKNTKDPIVKIYYGEFNDYPEGTLSMTMYMRKNILDKLEKSEYYISPDSFSKKELIIQDSKGKIIDPIIPGFCY